MIRNTSLTPGSYPGTLGSIGPSRMASRRHGLVSPRKRRGSPSNKDPPSALFTRLRSQGGKVRNNHGAAIPATSSLLTDISSPHHLRPTATSSRRGHRDGHRESGAVA